MPDQKPIDESVVQDEQNEDQLDPQYPTDAQISAWHAKYPYSALRGYPFPGMYIVYRSYTMAEEEVFLAEREAIEEKTQKAMGEKDIELMLAKKYVIWPEDFSKRIDDKAVPPGLPSMIANLIMVISGYADIRPEIL